MQNWKSFFRSHHGSDTHWWLVVGCSLGQTVESGGSPKWMCEQRWSLEARCVKTQMSQTHGNGKVFPSSVSGKWWSFPLVQVQMLTNDWLVYTISHCHIAAFPSYADHGLRYLIKCFLCVTISGPITFPGKCCSSCYFNRCESCYFNRCLRWGSSGVKGLAHGPPTSRCLYWSIKPELRALKLGLFSTAGRILRLGNIGSRSLTHAQWALYHWATSSAPWKMLRLPLQDLLELCLLSAGVWIGAQHRRLKINSRTCEKPTLESKLIPYRGKQESNSNNLSPGWVPEIFLKCFML